MMNLHRSYMYYVAETYTVNFTSTSKKDLAILPPFKPTVYSPRQHMPDSRDPRIDIDSMSIRRESVGSMSIPCRSMVFVNWCAIYCRNWCITRRIMTFRRIVCERILLEYVRTFETTFVLSLQTFLCFGVEYPSSHQWLPKYKMFFQYYREQNASHITLNNATTESRMFAFSVESLTHSS